MSLPIYFAILLLIIGGLNLFFAKNLLYPPVIFSFFWAFLLLVLGVFPGNYYAISINSLAIFTLGVVFFSVGGLLTHYAKSWGMALHQTTTLATEDLKYRPHIQQFLLICLIAGLASLPFYLHYLYTLNSVNYWDSSLNHTHPVFALANKIRLIGSSVGFGHFKYLIAWLGIFSLVALVELTQNNGRKLIFWSLTLLFFTFQILSMARTGVVMFLLAFIALYFISQQKIHFKWLLLGACFLLVAFIIPAVFLQKGVRLQENVWHNFLNVLQSLKLYLVGSLIAFDQALFGPTASSFTMPPAYTLRFFSAVLHALGLNITVPNIILPYIAIPLPINIYTQYFSWYIDFGLAGASIIITLLGFVITMAYRLALQKNPVAMIIYAVSIAALLLSNLDDFFIVSFSLWLQIIIISLCVYKIPFLVRRFTQSRYSLPEKS